MKNYADDAIEIIKNKKKYEKGKKNKILLFLNTIQFFVVNYVCKVWIIAESNNAIKFINPKNLIQHLIWIFMTEHF